MITAFLSDNILHLQHFYLGYNFLIWLLVGQLFAIKSKIKNIVFHIKAKKVFFKVLSQFN